MIIRDTVTRMVYQDNSGPDEVGYYRAKNNAMLGALVDSIQSRHGTRVVTIKILAGRVARFTRYNSCGVLERAKQFARTEDPFDRRTGRWSITEDDARKSLKEHGQVAFKSIDIIGDAAILVSAKRLKLDTDEQTDTTGMTPTQIKRAFVKHSVGASKNRVFVQTVMPFLA